MDGVGTDVQFLSPRPFTMLSRGHTNDVRIWARSNNDLIARTVLLHPTRFRGIAGLPQFAGEPIQNVFDEIDYALDELGFIGVLLNPDPGEGVEPTPPMGDPYWFPLYEKLCTLDIPALVHSCGCYGRETYDEHFISEESLAITSIARSDVFRRYPTLKLIVSHGGGSVPYQIGRWRSNRQLQIGKSSADGGFGYRGKASAHAPVVNVPDQPRETFDETLKRFWFDTVLHNKLSLELLFDVVGGERCLFGTERPGSGSGVDPVTNRPYDDLKPVIESIAALTDADKEAIFEGNARSLFPRFSASPVLV
jgi:4-oxalmesaconate hydratase